MSRSNLSGNQILQKSYDEASSSLKVLNGSLINVSYDYGSVAYPTATQEIYTFKSGGSGGTTVLTITINYVDASKSAILNFSRI